jgi:hypothetical protein
VGLWLSIEKMKKAQKDKKNHTYGTNRLKEIKTPLKKGGYNGYCNLCTFLGSKINSMFFFFKKSWKVP